MDNALKDDILDVLSAHAEIAVVILFGSAAGMRLTPHSDVDIAVAGEGALPHTTLLDLQCTLCQKLQREVDLVDLHNVSGLILREVLCTGKLLKKSSIYIYAYLLRKLWYNEADMMPHTIEILNERARRFAYGQ